MKKVIAKKTKWTPGPWIIYRRYIQGSNCTIGKLSEWTAFEEEREANASLISTAPELYDVLSRILEELPSKRDWLDPVLEKRAKDALSKARG